MRWLAGLSAVLLLFAAAGCKGGSSSKTAETAAKSPPAARTPIDPATVATIAGTVMLEGTPPTEEQISLSADPVCGETHKEPMFTERAVVRDGKVKWAFVYIEKGLENRAFDPPAEPAVMDQVGCRYIPHVMGVMVGQNIKFLNSDATLHNVHATATRSRAFNIGLAVQGMGINRKFDAPEIMVPLKCDVHSWMQAYVGVVAHPFFAVTGDDGGFKISGLPPGRYTLAVWHETFGTQSREITVGPSESKTADFTLKVTS